MPTRILFLAAQLQPFLVSGIKCVLAQDKNAEVLVYAQHSVHDHLLSLPKGTRFTLFQFQESPQESSLDTFKSFAPDIVFCAGWMYPLYLSWAKQFKLMGARTICGMDTQWTGSLKQRVLAFFSAVVILPSFTHAWVPGFRQRTYALRLGFHPHNILDRLYAPDIQLFIQAGNSRVGQYIQGVDAPKRFLYVGRLEPHKVENLLLAFRSLNETELNGWELTLVGDGSLQESALLEHPAIKRIPGQAQCNLLTIALEHSVFCLCSSNEPWGTVAQEFAATAMPLLISRQCGSSELMNDENAIFCNGMSVVSIKNALKSIIAFDDNTIKKKAVSSHNIAQLSSSEDWAKILLSIV